MFNALSFATVVSAIALIGSPPASAAGVPHYSLDQLMASDGYSGLSFSPDGRKLMVQSARTGVGNLYVLSIDDGKLTPLTSSTKETIGAIGYFPNDERVLYTSDHGGDELNHIFVRETDGSVKDLTPGAKLKAKFVSWAPDGRSFFLVTTERDPRFFDLYRYDARTYARQKIFDNDKGYQIETVSPDGRWVGLSRIVDNASTSAYLFDTTTKTLRPLTPETPGVVSVPAVFTRDNGAIFYTTDRGTEFVHLVRRNLKTGAERTVFETHWDVDGAALTRDGRYLQVSVDEDARRRVQLLDAVTFKLVAKPKAAGAIERFVVANGGRRAAFVEANGDTPGDVNLLDLKTGATRRLLSSLSPEVNKADLVAGQVVRFKSYDGLQVPGILYTPRDGTGGFKRPAVISVHGGPGGESTVGFRPLVQYLVNNGYVVYEINNRGSSGSGKTFNHLDDHKHGDADLEDVVAAKADLARVARVDPGRVAIEGQSYGGFMALAGLTFRPTAFAAGIDLYGISNWVRLLPNTPPWWDDLRRMLATEMGDYRTEGDYLRSISPAFHADQIRRPLLVLQGANDPRVLPVESEDIVARVKANGVPVQYVLFPDEGHGFRKKANQAVAYETVKTFLDTYLKPQAKREGDQRYHVAPDALKGRRLPL